MLYPTELWAEMREAEEVLQNRITCCQVEKLRGASTNQHYAFIRGVVQSSVHDVQWQARQAANGPGRRVLRADHPVASSAARPASRSGRDRDRP